MADVAVSEPAQSLMSIVPQDGPEDTGRAAVIPGGRQHPRKSRVRKVRAPDPKGGKGTKEKKSVSTPSRPPPHRDYLSEQRAKRLEKLKSKGKAEVSRKAVGRIKVEDTKEMKEEEGSHETVKEADGSEEIVKEVERTAGQGEELRGVSAGSDVSKDEGISSNGEKDEELELEYGESGGKIGDARPVEDIDDDEGRGSIKDEEDLALAPHSGVEEADAEALLEAPEEDTVGESRLEPELEKTGDSTLTTIPQEEEEEEVKPDVENLKEPQTTDRVSGTSETKEGAEEKTNDVEDDANGYHGDMDEPNSLAASYQGSLGLSSDAGLGTTADSLVLKSSLEDVETVRREEEEEGKEHAYQQLEDSTPQVEAKDEDPQLKDTEEQPEVDEKGEEQTLKDEDTGKGEHVKVEEEPEEEEETVEYRDTGEREHVKVEEEPKKEEEETLDEDTSEREHIRVDEEETLEDGDTGEEEHIRVEEEETLEDGDTGEGEHIKVEEEETLEDGDTGEGEHVKVEEEPEEEETLDDGDTGEGEHIKVEEEPEEEETLDDGDAGKGEHIKIEEKPEEEETLDDGDAGKGEHIKIEEKPEEEETLEEEQESTYVEEEEEEEGRASETEKLTEETTEDTKTEREADELEQTGDEGMISEGEAEAHQVDAEETLPKVTEEEEELTGEDEEGGDGGYGGVSDDREAVDDGGHMETIQEREMEDIVEEGERDDQEDEDVEVSGEARSESMEAPDTSVIEAESENSSESKESEKEHEEEEENEEEIQEIPAIAKIPGRYRGRRNQTQKPPQIQEPEVKKTPRSKAYDRSRVMANRKPISWRPTPVQASSQSDGAKIRNDKLPNNKFKARNLTQKTSEDQNTAEGEEEEPALNHQENDETDSGSSPRDHPTETLELPPVNIPVTDDASLVLESFRSEGNLSQPDSQADEESKTVSKAESMPDMRYQDLTRPNTAGKKGKNRRRKKVKPRVASTPSKSSAPQQGQDRSTSEVWVPHEDKLYVYTYSSQPRLLHVRRMGAGRVATTHQWDQDPNSSFRLKTRGNGNPMYDRRVVRGSNYSKRLGSDEPPKWNPYFTNARSLEQQNEHPDPATQTQRRQEFREKLEARARLRRESHGVSSLYPSHHQGPAHHPHRSYARVHVHVQTENHYEPLERPPEAEAQVQTDPWGEDGAMPPVVFQTPRGVDVDTQVYDSELDAGDEEEVLVAALVRRTMNEAVLEVAQEEQAEEDRINRLAASSFPSFLKAVDTTQEVKKNGEEEETAKEEERKDPDGKETSPEDTQEAARSPGEAAPEGEEAAPGEVKEIHLITAVEAAMSPVPVAHDSVQESQSLVM